MNNLLNLNLTNVKINGNVNSTVTLPGNEKDIERFMQSEGVNDYLIEKE
jgi:hypothetical protein